MKNILKKRVYIFALLSLILILIVLSAPLLAPNDPYLTNPALIRKGPSMLYPLGTDSLGRCYKCLLWRIYRYLDYENS